MSAKGEREGQDSLAGAGIAQLVEQLICNLEMTFCRL
jgi:hypothetical protein